MALVSMRQLLDHAAEHGYGVPAFNVNNMEQIKAIMQAARKTHSPVILQGSAGARKYARRAIPAPSHRRRGRGLARAFPIVMHQDHGASPDVCMGAIRSGFTVGDDGRLAQGRCQDARRLRLQCRGHAQGGRHSRTPSACRSKANSAASARWKPSAATRKTAMAPRASCHARSS